MRPEADKDALPSFAGRAAAQVGWCNMWRPRMRTLLLADDSLSVASAVELAFANRDVKVVAVLSGDRAIAQLETAPPDVILADIGMAGLDGYAVAAYVTQTERLRHIPGMWLASPFEPIDEERARETR